MHIQPVRRMGRRAKTAVMLGSVQIQSYQTTKELRGERSSLQTWRSTTARRPHMESASQQSTPRGRQKSSWTEGCAEASSLLSDTSLPTPETQCKHKIEPGLKNKIFKKISSTRSRRARFSN